MDIAGLVAGASKGEGLGNQFLSHIRQVDAIAHVLRCFADPDVVHVGGKVDPRGDRDVVETELMLKDLEQVEKRREKKAKDAKAPGKPGELAKAEIAVLDLVKAGLEKGVAGAHAEARARRRSPSSPTSSCSPASRCSTSPTSTRTSSPGPTTRRWPW